MQHVICAQLLGVLSTAPDRTLVFHYQGRSVKSGYHLTEVKTGQYTALDCDANPDPVRNARYSFRYSRERQNTLVRCYVVRDHPQSDVSHPARFDIEADVRGQRWWAADGALLRVLSESDRRSVRWSSRPIVGKIVDQSPSRGATISLQAP